ncbi:MAG: porin family protein, partial [Flavobacteriales bacterium]
MKKVYVTFLALLFGASHLFAQTDNSVRLGIKLAPNMAWVRSDTKSVEGDGSVLGYSFGLMAEFPFGTNGNYRFATGLFLNNVGGKVKYSGADTVGITTSTVRLRYIDLPVTMKLMTNEIGYMRYYGQLGIDVGVNLRAKSDAEMIPTRT